MGECVRRGRSETAVDWVWGEMTAWPHFEQSAHDVRKSAEGARHEGWVGLYGSGGSTERFYKNYHVFGVSVTC